MNKKNLIWVFLVGVGMTLGITSCSDEFLEVPTTGTLGESQLSTSPGVEGTLIGTYAALRGVFGNRFEGPNHWVTGSIRGGEANKGTDPGDYSAINPIQRYEINPTSGDANALWRARYEGVSRANSTIRLATGSELISDAQKTRIIAEARMLRGHFFFDLKRAFNSIPVFDETVPAADIPTVSNSPDVWGFIEADFEFAYNNLPETQSEAGRVNK